MFYFFSPKSQKATVRITHYPDPAVTTALADDDAGDPYSVVVDIVGDTVTPFPAVYNSRFAQLLMPHIESAPNKSTHSGAIVMQADSPITAQFTPVTASIGVLVFMAAGQNFNFSDFTDMPFNESVNYTDSMSLRSKGKQFGRTTPQASVRDMFAMKFPYQQGVKPVGHSGFMNPDQTRGPVDAAKRFFKKDNYPLPIVDFTNQWTYDDEVAMLNFFLPFTLWSGSKNYKVFPNMNPAPTQGYMFAIKVNPNENTTGASHGCGGFNRIDLSKTSCLAFTIPFSSQLPALEVASMRSVNAPDEISISAVDVTVAITSVQIYESVGDDFCVYLPHAPPFILYSVESKKKATAAPKNALGSRPSQ